jgi:hypothetical protein
MNRAAMYGGTTGTGTMAGVTAATAEYMPASRRSDGCRHRFHFPHQGQQVLGREMESGIHSRRHPNHTSKAFLKVLSLKAPINYMAKSS